MLKNETDARVIARQMGVMFLGLRKNIDAQVEDFIENGANMVAGETIIPSAIFEGPCCKETIVE